ncbi:MAG: SusE domain-containing protein [Prevotella sp.]|nr:SusE domain-containing protein [Prevotella sp.]
MKNIIKSTLLLLCSIGLFAACADDRDHNPTIVQPAAGSFVLNTPAYSSSTIDLETTSSLPLTWSQPNYGGFPVAANYYIQISLDGNYTVSAADEAADESGATVCNYVELANPLISCSADLDKNQLAAAITTISKWETDDDVPATQDVYVRVKSTFSSLEPVYSNVIKLTVVPVFAEAASYPEYIYEIGNESGWATVHPLRSPNFDGIYQGYYYMDGEFKFRPNEGDWNGDWELGTVVNETEGTFEDNGGSNFTGVDAGFYQIDANMTAEPYTYKMTLVESISIIGTVNGNWDDDTDLTYNTETGAWEATATLNAGEMKFRMNHDWAVSWGGADGDGTAFDNLTQNGGANLQLESAGTYKIELYISYEGNNRVVVTAQ